MSDNLDKIIEALTPDEQRQLRERLDERFAQQAEAAKMEAFHQALLASGLVKTIRKPCASTTGPRRLIEVKGKPLSETIIEERETSLRTVLDA